MQSPIKGASMMKNNNKLIGNTKASPAVSHPSLIPLLVSDENHPANHSVPIVPSEPDNTQKVNIVI